MSGSPPTRESRRADKFARLERKYGDRLRRQDKVATDGKIELTQAEYDAVMADNDALRADAIRCRFAEPRTLTVRQKAQMAQELANLRRDFRNREDESTDPAVAVKALPGVSDYPYPYRRDQKDSNDIRDDYEAIQTQIVDILTKYIDIEKARRIIGLGLLPRMGDDFTSRDSTWADSDDNTRRLLLAYINSRLVEYIFCPPGPHSDWPAPGQNFRKEGLWVVSQWDVGFGLSAFKYFEEIEAPVREHFPELLPEMHELRARMVSFLDLVHGEPTWDQDLQALDHVFGMHFSKMVGDDPKKQNDYLQRALEIIHKAFDLVVKVKRSKESYVFVSSGGEPGSHQRELFLIATQHEAKKAKLFVVPGLLRETFWPVAVVVRAPTMLWADGTVG